MNDPLELKSNPIELATEPDESGLNDNSKTPPTSNSETREIVTPYAFTVSPELLGEPLASPSRRGFAMLIDLFLIGVLSTISSLVLAGFVALTFFRAGNQIGKKNAIHYAKAGLRGTAALIVFFLVFAIAKNMGEGESGQNQVVKFDKTELIEIVEIIAVTTCKLDEQCVKKALQAMTEHLIESEISRPEAQLTFDELLTTSALPTASRQQVLADLMNDFDQATQEKELQKKEQQQISPSAASVQTANGISPANLVPTEPTASYSILEWVKGIMSDLGLGLGWAALYFSVFTAWWNGQTIGKKLLRIKVVRLDGCTPTLWESFGRYGGYGAGFATGLLGFLQLYWDPNRQAIQDKISETLVLRVKR